MKAVEAFNEIVAARLDPEAILFVARTGEEYAWRECPPGQPMTSDTDAGFPDAWVFGSISWPVDADLVTQREFFDDLLAEMETMADGPDRCRWEFDDPYHHRH